MQSSKFHVLDKLENLCLFFFFWITWQPDITAPGLNILAAWTEGNSPTKLESDTRVVKYNILSGTSMSCPHVAGVAALLRAAHPTWSNAAIRSAIMTSGMHTLSEQHKTISNTESIIVLDLSQFNSTKHYCLYPNSNL